MKPLNFDPWSEYPGTDKREQVSEVVHSSWMPGTLNDGYAAMGSGPAVTRFRILATSTPSTGVHLRCKAVKSCGKLPARSRCSAPCLVSTARCFAKAVAAELDSAVRERIAAVEKNLLPAVRIKGQTAPMALADRMRELHVPGVSVAVINDGKIEWAKGYGAIEAGKDTPVTADTLFQAASISKPLSALAVLRLVDKGALDLDRDVNEYLTSWKVAENEFTRQHAVDLRGILSHTAGLTVHGFDGYRVGAAMPTLQQTLKGTPPANNKPVLVDKVPGKGFRYAGGGTTVMQLLLTEVTAKTFTELMHESVLSPLAMASSTYEQPLSEALQARAASGHDEAGQTIAGRWHVYPERAAAGLWTTPSDLARYAIEVQQAHAGKSQTILSKKMVDQMLTPQGEGPMGLGPRLESAGRHAAVRPRRSKRRLSLRVGRLREPRSGGGGDDQRRLRRPPGTRGACGHRQRLRLARLPGRREDDRQTRTGDARSLRGPIRVGADRNGNDRAARESLVRQADTGARDGSVSGIRYQLLHRRARR